MPRLRIHFTDADIARTRLKLEIDLMWEVVSSVQILQHADEKLSFDPWRRLVRTGVSGDGHLRRAVCTLTAVAPHASYFPDFLTPATDIADIDLGADAVLSTPVRRLRTEVDRIRPTSGPTAGWLSELAHHKPAAMGHLRDAIRLYFRSLLEPRLHLIDGGLRIECAKGIQRYLSEGPEGLLRWLSPTANWVAPVLSVDGYPHDRDLHLNGRGLVLIPCYFCVHHPVTLADPELPPVLVFPIRPESRLLARARSGDQVTALLGGTRAMILRSVVNGSTTTRLARMINVAPATVSHHTTVLRDAGLITTHRHENYAVHTITTLGLQVLAAGPIGGSV